MLCYKIRNSLTDDWMIQRFLSVILHGLDDCNNNYGNLLSPTGIRNLNKLLPVSNNNVIKFYNSELLQGICLY